mmetsp:Transcript_9366/g.13879  ORF Transcript_9366/g.13879 Transcript_9366/m.13879 type:complete len:552 (-) Transcript_9366:137-1792(-)|eukprot:CAMPEP_0196816686 /NCGR_PEP_ID=MMETSP1362-20130617/56699_1 /TAXON_ID=163516 /ORGANISM="Leptocylindrus danicus, Strain CCMP1856" /LENGTH=551 /DNA_ID=CAMNT_0042194123 /DNA_START=78 /DNA_END=1733 /DNA_ORIENTATION=-
MSSRIQAELEELRRAQVAQSKRKNIKDDGTNDFTAANQFFDKQRQLKQEEQRRREEAQGILRGYKGYVVPGSDEEKALLQEQAKEGKRHSFTGSEYHSSPSKGGEAVPMTAKTWSGQSTPRNSSRAPSPKNDEAPIITKDAEESEIAAAAAVADNATPTGEEEEAAQETANDPVAGEQPQEEAAPKPIRRQNSASADAVMNRMSSSQKKWKEYVPISPKRIGNGSDANNSGEKWRSFISSEPGAQFPPEAGRYHLIVAHACPWTHRCMITRAMKGLQDAISICIVHPIWQRTKPDVENDAHCGWIFANAEGGKLTNTLGLGGPFLACYPGNEQDPIKNVHSVRDLYEMCGDSNGKYTLPILWDLKENTIVSNESVDIMRMFNSSFAQFAKNEHIELYPEELREKIDDVNKWIYPSLNNGVYKCGLAGTQAAYDKAINELTLSFDCVDAILQKQKYIAGDVFTEADVRLFVTLIRFDEVYSIYFKTNTRSVMYTPSMMRYCREIYRIPGVAETCNFEQIKAHYFCSHPSLNKLSIIPRGPNFEMKLVQDEGQ